METKMWRIEFETGDSLTTADEALAALHRAKGRMVTLVERPEDAPQAAPDANAGDARE